MKKLILSIPLMAFLSIGALAQGVSGGLKAGLNITNVKASGGGFSVDTKSLVGFHGGVYITVMFTDRIGIQPEALYSTQGYKYEFSGFSGTDHINYLTIPILIRFNVNDMISFHAGPQVGLVVSAESESGGSTTDIKDQINGTDISLAFGGTVDLPMKLNFTARYCMGLSDIDENSNSTTKGSAFQISVGYKLFGVSK